MTPLSVDDLLVGFWYGFCHLMGGPPDNLAALELVTAHVKTETGLRHCHNFAIGNRKSADGDGLDYQYYACNEILDTPHAEKLSAADPKHVVITERRSGGKCVVWFYPKHRGCRFAAFESLAEACMHHLSFLMRRDKVWSALVHADPVKYCSELESVRYYTADKEDYTKTVVDCFCDVQRRRFDFSALPVLGEHEKERLRGLSGIILDAASNGDITPIA